MLKEPDLARYSSRPTHRTYTRQFKAELVVACQQPGASIAAIALQHGMNANVLHRWLKEHERDGRHRLIGPDPLGVAVPATPVPAFIPLKLPTSMLEPTACDIKVELRKGAVSMILTWPASAAADLVHWTRAILK
ncbi:transposase IS3/IS911 [Rhodoferax ferrireducens T118]|uniref:Transposase IS3/IS911 n=1 Tax=Albidiferax ferrireducens (strain ATCC BAA-621 / DSM 15236 / T118) TaxID=338969 RepID=Q21TY2_ALBFT|nr:transposase [Rhodoferax ferrireducens]ABD68909.1 transposase IS3/IS911 [Rhodoferax ferrireducens T118]ABD70771.1 transposase IS3/IS911 [Rhodoferax ferrireducens T118]